MNGKIIQPGQERVLVIGGPANGQSHHIDAGSDKLKILSPVSAEGIVTGNPIEFTYKVRKLRFPDPDHPTGDGVFRIATHESVSLTDAFNALFLMYHLGQVGGSTQMPDKVKADLWKG